MQPRHAAPGTELHGPFPGGLSHIAFSFTNHCNLRCVYCPQGTHPDEFHADTPPEQIEKIIAYVRRNAVRKVSIGYYGETMMIAGWEQAMKPLLGQGIFLNLVSNFSKPMTAEEVVVVSRFDEVQISIDSIDHAVLKRVRKAVDVRTILYNTHLIRSHALRHGLPMPRLIWTAVLTDQVFDGMPDLVAMAISSGIPAVNYSDLAYVFDRPSDTRHVLDMPEDAFLRGFVAMNDARRLALGHGMDFRVGGSERIDRRARALLKPVEHGRITRTLRDAGQIDPGQPVYIYGAGSAGRRLRSVLGDGIVRGYIDSERDGQLDGLPVLSFERYRSQAQSNDLILIGSSFEDEIEGRLLQSGIRNYLRAVAWNGRPDADKGDEPSGHREPLRRKGIQGDYAIAGDETDDVPAGMTRLCDSPWTEVFLDPKGEAYACCFRGRVMGILRGNTTIDDIMAGEAYRDLRRQLLSGQGLDPECRRCSGHPVVTPQAMTEHVRGLFERAGGKEGGGDPAA